MRKLLSQVLRDIRGNTLILPAVGAVTLVGGAGLGVDTVQWYLWKRQLQQAVDSAALAGGQSLRQGTDSETSAKRELKRNADTAPKITRMANPPITGSYTGNGLAMEVIATIQQPLPFSSLFLRKAPTIQASPGTAQA
jgi:Flp pilus assembly protein TadG